VLELSASIAKKPTILKPITPTSNPDCFLIEPISAISLQLSSAITGPECDRQPFACYIYYVLKKRRKIVKNPNNRGEFSFIRPKTATEVFKKPLEAVLIHLNNLFMAISGCNCIRFFCQRSSTMASKTFFV
jgi:hypothetical protein